MTSSLVCFCITWIYKGPFPLLTGEGVWGGGFEGERGGCCYASSLEAFTFVEAAWTGICTSLVKHHPTPQYDAHPITDLNSGLTPPSHPSQPIVVLSWLLPDDSCPPFLNTTVLS